MSGQMREAVARAIDQEIPSIVPWGNKVIERCADAAIAAARPFIEAALIERLAQEADACYDANGDPDGPVFALDMYGNEIADWLRAQGGQG